MTENEISDFLGFINAHLPSAKLKREDGQHFYAGLRPLVDDGARSTYSASRRAELIDHGKDDAVEGLFSAIGGKWTTSRHLAEKTVDVIAAKLGKATHPCATAITKLPGAGFEYRHPDVTRAIHEEMAMTLEDVVMRRTGIGQLGDPGSAVLEQVAAVMANELGWDEARRPREIQTVQANFRTRTEA